MVHTFLLFLKNEITTFKTLIQLKRSKQIMDFSTKNISTMAKFYKQREALEKYKIIPGPTSGKLNQSNLGKKNIFLNFVSNIPKLLI